MVNLRSIPLASNSQSCLGIQTGFYRERNNKYIFGHISGQYFLLGLGGKERIKSLRSTI